MGGCSIVFLFLWPVLVVWCIAALLVKAAVDFMHSPAFPFLILSLVCNVSAFACVLRIAWRKYWERDAFEVGKRSFLAPLMLCAVGFVALVIVAAMAGEALVGWVIQNW